MTHLNDVEFVDLLDGRLPPARAAHSGACAECSARADAMRTVLEEAREVDVPEPSPLFWQHLSSRIDAGIRHEEVADRREGQDLLRGRALGWSAAALIALAVMATTVWRGSHSRIPMERSSSGSAAGVPVVMMGEDAFNEDIESDDAWVFVRAVAEDVGWDETKAAGVGVRMQAADVIVTELSRQERAELARLIKQELRKDGA